MVPQFFLFISSKCKLIIPHVDLRRSWRSVVPGKKDTRLVNGILSLLCKEHFPGLVEFAGRMEPAYTWEHYTVVPDLPDRDGRVFNNKAHRVTSELWVSPPGTSFIIALISLFF